MQDAIPSNVAAALAAAVPAVTLLLLYAYARKAYILSLMSGWLLMGGSLFAADAVGISHLMGVLSAAAFLHGAYGFENKTAPETWHAAALVFAALLFGVGAESAIAAYVLPFAYMVSAAILAYTGYIYLGLASRRKLLAAGLTGMALSLVAVNIVGTMSGALAGYDRWSAIIFVINSLLFVFAGLGMHLLVFEEMTHDVRRMNRELSDVQAQLVQLATSDELTGCHNRRFIEQVMPHELQRHRRYSIPLSILFIDIDRFKSINDAFGHAAGDKVLQYVAGFLKQHIREADYVVRWGGDEFVVVLSCTEQDAAGKAAALQAQFDRSSSELGLPSRLRLSVGVAEVSKDAADFMQIVHSADGRMYQDKERGNSHKKAQKSQSFL